MRVLKTLDTEEEMFCFTKQEIRRETYVIWAAIIISFIFGYIVRGT